MISPTRTSHFHTRISKNFNQNLGGQKITTPLKVTEFCGKTNWSQPHNVGPSNTCDPSSSCVDNDLGGYEKTELREDLLLMFVFFWIFLFKVNLKIA